MWITAELLALAAVTWVMLWRLDDWREWALCAEVDPDAFFPEKGESTRAAKNICRRCLVKVECLSSALANDERFGVWGGLSDRERRRLRRMSSESPATHHRPHHPAARQGRHHDGDDGSTDRRAITETVLPRSLVSGDSRPLAALYRANGD